MVSLWLLWAAWLLLYYIDVYFVINCKFLGMNSFRAAVCYREFPSKLKFQNSSKSVRKNPLVRHFGKSQSKFPKSFQSPWEKKRFKETSSSLAGNNRHPGQLQYYLVKNIARWCILYSAKKSPKILIFSTFIRNENLQNFEEKNHALVHGTLE